MLFAVLTLTLLLAAIWGLRFLELQGDMERFARYWSEPRGEVGGLLYVALGDSTAQGIGASEPERGYVGLIARRLRESTGRGVEIVNLSRTGARVRDVVTEQLPKLAGLNPDLVTVEVGGNDVRQYDASRFHSDVDALVAGLPPNSVVGDAPWFMHGVMGQKSTEAAEYVARAAGARDLPVAGIHQAMRDRGWTTMFTGFAADWFHPNDRGYRMWAEAFWEPISSDARLAKIGVRT